MSLVDWAVFGAVAAVLINIVDPHPSGGVLGNIILGVFGAVIGGMFSNLIFAENAKTFFPVILILTSLFTIGLLALSRILRRL